MKMEINSKFNIGDIVQKYEKRVVYDSRIKCPLCEGKYKVFNPNWDEDEDEDTDLYSDEYLICPHCEKGWVETKKRVERHLDEELYYVNGITASFEKDKDVKYGYYLKSTPELNNREHRWFSIYVKEDELEGYKINA